MGCVGMVDVERVAVRIGEFFKRDEDMSEVVAETIVRARSTVCHDGMGLHGQRKILLLGFVE